MCLQVHDLLEKYKLEAFPWMCHMGTWGAIAYPDYVGTWISERKTSNSLMLGSVFFYKKDNKTKKPQKMRKDTWTSLPRHGMLDTKQLRKTTSSKLWDSHVGSYLHQQSPTSTRFVHQTWTLFLDPSDSWLGWLRKLWSAGFPRKIGTKLMKWESF